MAEWVIGRCGYIICPSSNMIGTTDFFNSIMDSISMICFQGVLYLLPGRFFLWKVWCIMWLVSSDEGLVNILEEDVYLENEHSNGTSLLLIGIHLQRVYLPLLVSLPECNVRAWNNPLFSGSVTWSWRGIWPCEAKECDPKFTMKFDIRPGNDLPHIQKINEHELMIYNQRCCFKHFWPSFKKQTLNLWTVI